MKQILVTGANGQLGSELQKLAHGLVDANWHFTDVAELDILDPQAVNDFVANNKITHIVNCAAYTAVDKAEEDSAFAMKLNAEGPKNLAQTAEEIGAVFIHVSTDFVFDGKMHRPYKETDKTNPISVYGETKLAGEENVLNVNPYSIIVRTSWLYSAHGGNFVKTMLRLGEERDSLGVIFDQIGTPTWASDLAASIIQLIKNPEAGKSKYGIYHFSNEGVASWYDFTLAIHQFANIKCEVSPIETSAYPTPAARPAYSVMNKSKIKADFGIRIPYWKTSLEACIKEIKLQS